MAAFGKHFDCRANNCDFIATTYKELKIHMQEHCK